MEGTAEEIKTNELPTDFSGNYIDKFKNKDVEEFFSGSIQSFEKNSNIVIFHGQHASLEISIIDTDILKFRYGIDGFFEDDFSYAIDPSFQVIPTDYQLVESPNEFLITTSTLKFYIRKANMSTKITTLDDLPMLEDEKGYHWQDHKYHGGNISISTKVLQQGEKFYGLGDKTCKLNLIGTRKEMWGTDCYGYDSNTDPVYKNIPFFMGQHHKTGYGIFLDNTFRTFFDFGKERPEACSFWAQGGELRYYYVHGPKLMDVIQKYAKLTGRHALPPKWALGYHQSKWSYYPESVVRKLAEEFRSRKIPCDVIHLDIDYMDGFRCFTWDKAKFPDPKKMIADLKQDGFKSIVIIDPGIKVDKTYWVYRQGVEGNHFCQRMDGALLKASVWPGLCHFPDFTKPSAREWWATLYKGLMEDGVDGVWNDMNEPATFEEGTFPIDVRFDFDGHPCSHRKAHNVYGMLMAKATSEGQKKYLNNQRDFTISRSAYAGVQRYASVWTGDNSASWDQLRIANIQCQRLSASGVSFVGSDVGGFIGSPDGELYTRWIQMAVFHPFFRTHSSGDHGDKEPWTFEKMYLDIVRTFIEMRYQLLPYIYSAFWQHTTVGTPIIRSMHLIGHDDPECFFREEEFFLGDHMIICPISEAKATSRKMYVPAGDWYNYWTDEKILGQQELVVEAALDQIPLFIREGAIIPMQPVMQYVDEFEFDALTLRAYMPTGSRQSTLYEDKGNGYDYQNGDMSVKTFESKWINNSWVIIQVIDGRFETSYKTYDIFLHGLKKSPTSIKVDGVEILKSAADVKNSLRISLSKNFKEVIIN